LSARAGELFAGAGSRAFASVDYITSRDLLGRAAALLPSGSQRRLDLVPYLGIALAATGLPEEAEVVLSEGVEQARSAGSERDALRATVRLLANRIYRSPTDAEIESAAVEVRAAIGSFESMGDDAGVAETALALMEIEYMRGRVAETLQWTSEALQRGLAAGRPHEATEAAAMLLATAIEGPLPVDRFAVTAGELSADDPISRSTSHALLAASALALGDDSGFREHERGWREVIDRNGLSGLGAMHAAELAIAEFWAGNPGSAELRLREAREILAPLGFIWWVDTLDGPLCSAVEAQDRPREFLRLADAFEASVTLLDRDISIRRQLVRARAHLIRGSAADAEVAARHGLELAGTSDLVLDQADALLTLADVLDARDLGDEAAAARREAIAKLRAKGNLAAVAGLKR
jgi:tetratricopeptide (TPR) repeat protein